MNTRTAVISIGLTQASTEDCFAESVFSPDVYRALRKSCSIIRWFVLLFVAVVMGLVTQPVHAQTDMVDSIRQGWQPVLGSDGPRIVDRVVDHFTPDCLTAQSETELIERAEMLRSEVIAYLGLDFEKQMRSALVQRRLIMDGYQIDVVRLEVYPHLFLPANIYVPDEAVEGATPLVLSLPGCWSGVESEYIQQLGGNLAKLGMFVIVLEGYCKNGSRYRTELSDHYKYASEMVGLPGGNMDMYLQELITTISWAIETYSAIDPTKIGSIGYSYGGMMSFFLGAVDTRVRSISIPATNIGEDCNAFAINRDIWLETAQPGFVWQSPLRIPILPPNLRVPLLYPRYLHITAGTTDPTLRPNFPDRVIDYGHSLYRLGAIEDRILLRLDDGEHGYFQNRREDTYEWLMYTLKDEPLMPRAEISVTILPRSEVAVDISNTATTGSILAAHINNTIWPSRFSVDGQPIASTEEISETVRLLFPTFEATELQRTLVWQQSVGNVSLQAYRVDTPVYAYPVFIFKNAELNNNEEALFLPANGSFLDIEQILDLLQRYQTVVSVDLLGVGEVKSNRILQHTFARYFMHNDPSVPKLNIELVRTYMHKFHDRPVVIYGSDWPTSLYSLFLRWLEPDRIKSVGVKGLPAHELVYLKSDLRLPDMLLWGDLYAKTSALELASALPMSLAVDINGGALDTLDAEVTIRTLPLTVTVLPFQMQVSNDLQLWSTVSYTESVTGFSWQLVGNSETATVYARLINGAGAISRIVSDTIRIAEVTDPIPGIYVNNLAEIVNSKAVTLTLIAPPHSAEMAIQNVISITSSLPQEDDAWQWEPYAFQREWELADDSTENPERVILVRFRDVAANVSPPYFGSVRLDDISPMLKLIGHEVYGTESSWNVRLKLEAIDDLSGVQDMQISTTPDFVDATWEAFQSDVLLTLHADPPKSTLFLRVRDHAGNISEVVEYYVTLAPLNSVFLPLLLR
jgi:hypothetical protein